MIINLKSDHRSEMLSKLQLNIIPSFKTLNILPCENPPISKKIARYTLTIFLERAISIHGDKYDYSEISENDIKGNTSRVKVTCKRCKYVWYPRIVNHISNKHGCPTCAQNPP